MRACVHACMRDAPGWGAGEVGRGVQAGRGRGGGGARHALLDKRLGVRGHGAGRDAADVGVVPARGDKEYGHAPREHRRDHRDVREMRATRDGVVGHEHVALPQVPSAHLHLVPHRVLSRARRASRPAARDVSETCLICPLSVASLRWLGARARARARACIDPRCTGMWGALATRPPPASKSAHEKSSRSLMLVLIEVRCARSPHVSCGRRGTQGRETCPASRGRAAHRWGTPGGRTCRVRPICSAMDMKRCWKMESCTGSAAVDSAGASIAPTRIFTSPCRPTARWAVRARRGEPCAHPGSVCHASGWGASTPGR